MSDVGELDRPGTPGSPGSWDGRSEEWLDGAWERATGEEGEAETSGSADEAVADGEHHSRADGRTESATKSPTSVAQNTTSAARTLASSAPWNSDGGSPAGADTESRAPERAPGTSDTTSPAPAGSALRAGRPAGRRAGADPVKALMHRHRDLCERAVDPLEIAAGLEAHGLTDRAAARYRHRDVFSLAEEMYARVPRGGDRPPPRTGPGEAPREHRAWAVLALLPGALCTATVIGLRFTEGGVRLAVAAGGALAVVFGLRAALARGPLHAPAHVTSGGARAATYWLVLYALLGDGLLGTALDGGPHGTWPPATGPVLALILACGPAAWCARLFAVRAGRRLRASRGLAEFASSVTPLLLGVFGLFLCALGALLALCGALLGEPAAYAGAGALGGLLLLARLLIARGFVRGPAFVLGIAAIVEAAALATVFAARLPGCSVLDAPVRHLADAWGADAVPALVCAPAALALLIHAIRTLTRASAHVRPPGSP
ncbi:hypothetical protein [Streptomyces sp. NPDC047009]|uniref:hypothetical protein n=1 Tax=Streptomyces sp. NPDC047009 TaxID=3154496 RepID=UPI0033FEFAA9